MADDRRLRWLARPPWPSWLALWRRRPALLACAVVCAVLAAGWLVVALSPAQPVSAPAPPASTAESTTSRPAPTPTTAAPTTTVPPPAPPLSPFTGLPAAAAPVLAVKIDNVRAARPPLGLTAADLVYVEPVEAGLSRLLAVFSSHLPAAVGPVRSARESDLELLGQFGRPALAYSGAAPELLPTLAAARVVNVSPRQAPQAYYRDRARRPPHNAYARPAQLLAAAPDATLSADIGLRFGPAAPGGTPSAHEVAGYPAAQVSFDWSPADGRWLVGFDGAPLLAAEGGRLGAATVVLQSVVVRPSGISDVLGNVSPYAQTVGAGAALVLRDGMRFPARWSRPTPDSGTAFTLPDGGPCPFANGPVWIVLVPAG
jgi:hypothetical protein